MRTLYQCGKLENVKKEMTSLKINILGINKTKWLKNSDFMIDNFKMIYSGGDKHERGVGLLLDQYISKCVLGYWTVSDRVLLVKIQGNPFNMIIIVVYAPTHGSRNIPEDYTLGRVLETTQGIRLTILPSIPNLREE